MRYLIFPLLVLIMACSPNESVVTLKVKSQIPLESNEKIFVAGNNHLLGNWDAGKIALTKSSESDFWELSNTFPDVTALEFKFTKGSWASEALNENLKAPGNHILMVKEDTTLIFEIPLWKDSLAKLPPEITGSYDFYEKFEVENLPARNVIVWLPPSYEADTTKKYPVLYIHDGQNVFDPNTSYHGHDWRIDEIADSLIQAGKIEEFIGVAIYCNPDKRAEEYSNHEPYGEYYQEFLCYQLKPFIDSTYRTKTDAENTAILGASMGGLISFVVAWEYPDVFKKAACMSPAFKFGYDGEVRFNYVDDVEAYDGLKKDLVLYIDNGTEDLEAELQSGIDDMMKVLKAKNYPFEWYLDEGAKHDEMAWSKRVWRPLIQFFGT